jgi:hypothetical protein
MLTAAKWLVIAGSGWLVFDAILIILGVANPLFGWPLPCPVTLMLLGTGLLLFTANSQAFRNT